jgi:branched-chain amino acid transport system ATP-binding protein
VSVSYRGVPALRSISLEVAPAETVCLIGANGSGKSTALKAALGFVPLTSGEIRFKNRSLKGMRTETIVAMGIGVVPEGRRVFPGLTVLENLKIGATLRPSGGESANLERVYELFPNLRDRRDQLAWSLSGGEQQMLSIGRALMGEPQLLMLDEPSLGLAPMIAEEVFNVIKTIAKTGTAVLVAEQNADLALKCSARAYVLENGALVLSGSSIELMSHPKVQAAFLGGD